MLTSEISEPVCLAGKLRRVQRLVSKVKRQQYARCVLEDATGQISLLVFPMAYTLFDKELADGRMIAVDGRLICGPEGAAPAKPLELVVDSIKTLSDE